MNQAWGPTPNLHGTSRLFSLQLDVVCGSDFSECSAQASQAAVALAERAMLVHAVDKAAQKSLPEEVWESMVQAAREKLYDEQKMLGTLEMAPVESLVCLGRPATVLVEEAKKNRASLIVVGPSRQCANLLWPSTTTAEEVAETAGIPTLVIRQAAPFLQWLRGDHRLRIFVATDLSDSSESALLWVNRLRSAGPCEIFAAHLEREDVTVSGDETVPSLFMDEMVMKAAHTPERLFEARMRKRFGLSHVHTRFEKGAANSSGKLIQLAVQDNADLIVLGTHSRCGWRRIGHRSVSRFLLRHAPVSVLVCPCHVTN